MTGQKKKETVKRASKLHGIDEGGMQFLAEFSELERTTNTLEELLTAVQKGLSKNGFHAKIYPISAEGTFPREYSPFIEKKIFMGTTAWDHNTGQQVFYVRGKNELMASLRYPRNERCIVATIDAARKDGLGLLEEDLALLKEVAKKTGQAIHNRHAYDRLSAMSEFRHDVVNKLVAIDAFAYRTQRITQSSPSETTEKVKTATDVILKASGEIADLLDITVPKGRDFGGPSEKPYVKDFVNDLIVSHYPVITKNDLTVILSVDNSLSETKIHNTNEMRIIDNCASNCFKYTTPGGIVLVSIYQQKAADGPRKGKLNLHYDFLNRPDRVYSLDELNGMFELGKRLADSSHVAGTSEGIGLNAVKAAAQEMMGTVIPESGERKVIGKAIDAGRKDYVVFAKGFKKCPTAIEPYIRVEVVCPLD